MLEKIASNMLLLALLILPLVPVQAQDTAAPTLIHRPAATGGPAGELQTFVARASDELELRSVTLFYRQGVQSTFQSIEMRRLFDSIDEYMIAIETARGGAPSVEYYIVAKDASGNQRSRGSQRAPLQLNLLPPATLAQSAPASVAGAAPSARSWIIGAAALLAVFALASGGGDSGAASGDTVPLTIFSPTPNQ